jgi:hypothetical protein
MERSFGQLQLTGRLSVEPQAWPIQAAKVGTRPNLRGITSTM